MFFSKFSHQNSNPIKINVCGTATLWEYLQQINL